MCVFLIEDDLLVHRLHERRWLGTILIGRRTIDFMFIAFQQPTTRVLGSIRC